MNILSIATHRKILLYSPNKYWLVVQRSVRVTFNGNMVEYELRQDPKPMSRSSDKIRYGGGGSAHSKSNAVMVNSPVSALIQKQD